MQTIYETIESVAKSDANVLIVGESGTGKELIANAIHYNSLRSKKPFIKVNCAAFVASTALVVEPCAVTTITSVVGLASFM